MNRNTKKVVKKAEAQKKIDTSQRIKNFLWVTAGNISLALGIIGIAVPLLPTTPFLLLAAACYYRGSKKMHDWLLNHKWFGEYIRNYQEKKGIPLKAKVYTISLLWITIIISAIFFVENIFIRIILVGIAVAVTIHILSFKTL